MNRLYLNIAAGVLVSSLIGTLVFVGFVHYAVQETERRVRSQELDPSTEEVISRLDKASFEEWPAIVESAETDGIRVVRIHPSRPDGPPPRRPKDKPPHAHKGPHFRGPKSRPVFESGPPKGRRGLLPFLDRPLGPPIDVPIKNGAYVVVLRQPPYVPLLVPPLVSVLLIVVLATLLVGWPLLRRIRQVDNAVAELGRGNLDVRLKDSSGALGQLATRLDESAASLKAMFAEREELLQAVSHELGTPISRIKFQLEMVRSESKDRSIDARLDAIHDDLEEMKMLSKELVSWLDAGREGLEEEEFEVTEVIETLVELSTEFDDRALNVQIDAPSAPLYLHAEPRLFQRAIENLLTNAVRYTDTSIHVQIHTSNNHIAVSVEDDGPGIPEEDRKRIFEPFVRLESSRSKDYGGIGLGMAIAGRILKAHGATITIGTSAMGGARIETRWPVTKEK